MYPLDLDGVLTNLNIDKHQSRAIPQSPSAFVYLDPFTEQYGISGDELMISEADDQRIKERPPRIVFLPLCIQESLAHIFDRGAWREASF